MKNILGILFFTFFLQNAYSVDRNLFKLCTESNFCQRLRSEQNNQYFRPSQSYSVLNNVFSVDLYRVSDNYLFTLKLSAYEDNIFRVEIDEKVSLKPRHRVTESLNPVDKFPMSLSFQNIIEDTYFYTIVSGPNRVVIHRDNFQIDFFNDNVQTVIVNPRNLMKFEELQVKSSPSPTDGSWEEDFKGFPDSKPNGPEGVSLDFHFGAAEVLFGIPEHADSFILNATIDGADPEPYRLYNLDVFEYELYNRMALYGSVPVIYAHGTQRTAGVFWNNAAETWADINDKQHWYYPAVNFMSESGIIDAFIMLGPKPNDVFKQYSSLTGVAPLPQLFSLGYHQSRWNYDNQSDVLEVNRNFDNYDIPMDTIWLDIEYTDSKKYFTWDLEQFPNSLDMIANISASGRHLVLIIDPHIKRDNTYFVHNDCTQRDYYVKNKDGRDFEGECWPGLSSYPDFLNPAVRDYYAEVYKNQFPGVTNDVWIWNDMNEPSVFGGPEVTMHKDNIHFGDWEHRHIHNLFGQMYLKTTYDSLFNRNQGQRRPFILSRAHFAGTQRYGAIWTGDNTAEWNHLKISISMCLSEAVAGISNCGADIGGFFLNPDNELLARWYQTGAFQPFYRGHAHMETNRREPWLYSELARLVIREAIRKRYSYLPLWYRMFYEHERYGLPIMRPMLSQFPSDTHSFKIDNQYMLADILLVHPVTEQGVDSVDVYFPTPAAIWYDVDTFQRYSQSGFQTIPVDMYKIPVFQRGGTILAKKDLIRPAAALMIDDPYSLVICLDATYSAYGSVYLDDEKSFRYKTHSEYLYLEYKFADNSLTNRLIDPNASFDTKSMLGRIEIVGLNFEPTSAVIKWQEHLIEANMTIEENSIVVYPVGINMQDIWTIEFNSSAGLRAFGFIQIILLVLLYYIC